MINAAPRRSLAARTQTAPEAGELPGPNVTKAAKVYALQVAKALPRLKGPYTLVVADPPYEYDRAESELTSVVERGLLAEDGVVVVEHSKRHEWPETLATLRKVDMRKYGDTRVSLYRR